MMKIHPLILVFTFALCSWFSPLNAQVLYNEGFDVLGEGALGTGPTTPATIVTPSGPWSVTGDFSGLIATTDYFKTLSVSGESVLEALDVDAEVCFVSDAIDISAYASVVVSVDISEVGDHEASDYADVILEVDGIPTLIADFSGLGSATHTLIGDIPNDSDWGSAAVTGSAAGSSLVVKVCLFNGAGDEKIRIDNVVVEVGSVDPPVSTPSVVINEINYNPIESGVDQTEFVELYNLEESAVDLSGWTLAGVEYTFPAGASIGAGEYAVLAGNAVAFEAAYGCAPDFEWGGGALSNSGETVTLSDSEGAVVDEVPYDDASPWPGGASGPDGNGPSLELLDPTAENSLPAFWASSIIDGGTPGAPNQTSETGCPAPDVVIDYKNSENGANGITNKKIQPIIRFKNLGTEPVDLSKLTARYYFTSDAVGPMTLTCAGSDAGCSSTTSMLYAISPAAVGADRFMEVGFSGGTIAPGAVINTKIRIGNVAKDNFDESDDYSFIGAPITDHVDNPYITLYYCGKLIQGTEPNLGGVVRTINPIDVSEGEAFQATVFPNPFSKGFVLELEETPVSPISIRLVSIMGQTVYQGELHELSTSVKLEQDIVSGVYFLQMTQGDKREIVQLIKK